MTGGVRATTEPAYRPVSDESPFRDRGPIDDQDAEEILELGELEILGRMPWSSNATFLTDVCHNGEIVQGVYKPFRGERPLWDFPEGLYQREVATYRLSRALRWSLIPPTVFCDGPLGVGSLQLFVPCDFEQHYFDFVPHERYHHTLQRFCAFDVVANSTDRKGGHLLVDAQDRIWGIDNGLTFHVEFKLRTVIWDWAGDPIPADIRDDLQSFLEAGLPDDLAELLDPLERDALRTRARALVREGHFPTDPTGRRFPWPLV